MLQICPPLRQDMGKRAQYYLTLTPESQLKLFDNCEKWWTGIDVSQYRELVAEGYGYQLLLDGLPAGIYSNGQISYDNLIPLGFIGQDENLYIFNHLHFRIQTAPSFNGWNIVSFAVEPISIDHDQMEKQTKQLDNKIKQN